MGGVLLGRLATGAVAPFAAGRAGRFNLLRALVVRDVKGLYRRSVLGPLWAVLQPLIYMLLFVFLRSVVGVTSEEVPYVIFTFSALVPWTFFSNAIIRSAPSIVTNAGIIKKIAVPREVFPAAAVAASSLDLVIASVILVGMMLWFAVPLTANLLWFPVLTVLTAILALGVGLIAAALGALRRDIVFALPFAMQFWLLATPIMYPMSSVPEGWQAVYRLNPMVGITEGFRAILVKGMAPDLELLFVSGVVTLLVWAIALPIFRWLSQYFADVL